MKNLSFKCNCQQIIKNPLKRRRINYYCLEVLLQNGNGKWVNLDRLCTEVKSMMKTKWDRYFDHLTKLKEFNVVGDNLLRNLYILQLNDNEIGQRLRSQCCCVDIKRKAVGGVFFRLNNRFSSPSKVKPYNNIIRLRKRSNFPNEINTALAEKNKSRNILIRIGKYLNDFFRRIAAIFL